MEIMKRYYAILLCLMIGGSTPLLAQTTPSLSALLELFSDDSERTYLDQLDGLGDSLFFDRNDGFRLADIELGSAQDSLWSHLNSGNFPTADSLFDFWSFNQGELESFLNNDTLSTADSTTLSSSFFNLNEIWNNNYDSLNANTGPFVNLNSDSLNVDFSGGDTRWEQYQGPWLQTYRELYNNELTPAILSTENGGLDSLQEVADNSFFSSALDFEIGFGNAWNDINFYEESYQTQSMVVRIASVPSFKTPLELRWALEGSFFFESQNAGDDQGVSLLEGFNPLRYSGNVALLYLPRFGSIGDAGSFHLYTSIGMDLGAYMPSHANNQSQVEANRIGKTTGFGPQIGAGFVVNYSALSLYSYGTVTTGRVVDDLGLNYRYDAASINAGIRFGNAVNAMFTSGVGNWAPKDGKHTVYSQFTIGIILDELIF